MHYNLCDEPWILLMKKDGQTETVGLERAFTNLQEYMSFAGEIQLQDTAMLRLFSALSVTMIYRMDVDGQEDFTTDKGRLMERFRTIWQRGSFPEAMVTHYFGKWRDRFDLSGDDRPFYQVPETVASSTIKKKGKELEMRYSLPNTEGVFKEMNRKPISSINGTILDSNNKPAAYTDTILPEKDGIKYMPLAKSARWLLWYMAFADCGTKASGQGKWASKMTFPSSGALVFPVGSNLFETVMMNSVLLKKDEEPYEEVLPAWENELSLNVQAEPYGDTAPQNLPELYTQQSRRIILKCAEYGVIDVHIIAGDWYSAANAFIEPMFLWKKSRLDQSGSTYVTIKYDTSSKWNNLRNILLALDTNWSTQWVEYLKREMNLKIEELALQTAGIEYGSTQSSIDKMVSDEIIINTRFLEDDSEKEALTEAISTTDELASKFYVFGKDLEIAKGAGPDFADAQGKEMKGVFLEEAELLLRRLLKGAIDKTSFYEQLQTICHAISEREMEEADMSAYMNSDMTAAMAERNLWRASRMILRGKEGK